MQMVRAVVDRELIVDPVELKAPLGDPVRISSDDGAEIGGVQQVGLEMIVAKHDVLAVSVAIGHAKRRDDCAVRDGV